MNEDESAPVEVEVPGHGILKGRIKIQAEGKRGIGFLIAIILAVAFSTACIATAVAYMLITHEVEQQRCESLAALVTVTHGGVRNVLMQSEVRNGCPKVVTPAQNP